MAEQPAETPELLEDIVIEIDDVDETDQWSSTRSTTRVTSPTGLGPRRA